MKDKEGTENICVKESQISHEEGLKTHGSWMDQDLEEKNENGAKEV